MASGKIGRIPLPGEVGSEEKYRLQPWVDPYTHWVVNRLVGIRGIDEQSVTYYILRDWIREHKAELAELGIEVKVRDGQLIVNHDLSKGA